MAHLLRASELKPGLIIVLENITWHVDHVKRIGPDITFVNLSHPIKPDTTKDKAFDNSDGIVTLKHKDEEYKVGAFSPSQGLLEIIPVGDAMNLGTLAIGAALASRDEKALDLATLCERRGDSVVSRLVALGGNRYRKLDVRSLDSSIWQKNTLVDKGKRKWQPDYFSRLPRNVLARIAKRLDHYDHLTLKMLSKTLFQKVEWPMGVKIKVWPAIGLWKLMRSTLVGFEGWVAEEEEWKELYGGDIRTGLEMLKVGRKPNVGLNGLLGHVNWKLFKKDAVKN